jgi:Zn-dependent protease with chaperone function
VDPAPSALASKEGLLADVMVSHPPIQQRIIRLKGMAYQQAKLAGAALGVERAG